MSDITITYKGNEITSMSATGTKTLLTKGQYCEDDITVSYTAPTPPAGSATTPTTTITANPTISVSNGGLITATATASQSITPTVVSGYVSSGTAGTVSVSGTNTQQLTAKAAQTYTPTTTAQTIAAGQYLTGAQTIAGDANLVAENIADGVSIFGVTGTHSGGGVEMITVTIYDDMGVLHGSFKEQNATLEQIIDYDLGRVWWELTTPKNSLFVIHSQMANASTTTTTGTYTSFCQPQQARVQGYVIFAYNLGETDGIITLTTQGF